MPRRSWGPLCISKSQHLSRCMTGRETVNSTLAPMVVRATAEARGVSYLMHLRDCSYTTLVAC